LLTLVAGLALGGLPATEPEPGSRLERLRTDQQLIEALVDGGLRLAGEDNPLRRAETCNALADKVAREVKRASAAGDRMRAADLGRQLQGLLERGVARNLSLAQGNMAEDSPLIPEMRHLGEKAIAVMGPVMHELESAGESESSDMRQALEGLSRARAEVERVILGPSKGPQTKRNRSER
jgi:hypothetical protein